MSCTFITEYNLWAIIPTAIFVLALAAGVCTWLRRMVILSIVLSKVRPWLGIVGAFLLLLYFACVAFVLMLMTYITLMAICAFQ